MTASPGTHAPLPAVSRRTALTIGGTAASALALAACSPSGTGQPPAGDLPAEPTEVGSLADLPVGGTAAAQAGDTPILLSRPGEDEVKAFSAICTHQQCVVAADFGCACHGSVFDTATGEPTAGPAIQPLPEYTVTLDGDTILVSA